jgi:hypothetical protein
MSSNQLISPTRSFLGWLLLLWFGRGGHLARSMNPKMNTIRVDLPWALGNNAFIRKK